MEDSEISWLIENSDRIVGETDVSYHRALFNHIDWSERLICLKGARGVGKTTLMKQYLKESYGVGNRDALFVSLDAFWFETHNLIDVADWHWKHGGKVIFVDEVHQRSSWPTLIKTIYDSYPSLKIVYSGSSLLRLDRDGADLSRRQMTYELPGLSFREYLSFGGILDYPAATLEEVLTDHVRLAGEVCANLRILEPFGKYLRYGYYPFFKESAEGQVREMNYYAKLRQVVGQVLEVDYPKIEEVTVGTIRKARKMLMILAESVPQTPKMTRLYQELETDRIQGLKILQALERAGLMGLISDEAATLKNLSRPDKIFLNNTNLMHALSSDVEIGCVRETFFLNQLRAAGYDVTYPKVGDFKVAGKYLFEVGGAGKTFDQIKDIPDSFVVNDGVEVTRGNKIPLWMFGMLY